MIRNYALLASVVALAAGCARTVPTPLGMDHPANPNAAVAPVPATPTMLALASATTAPSPEMDRRTPSRNDTTGGGEHEHHHVHGGAHADPMPVTKPAATRPAATATYVCPMHPEVTSDRPGTCPKCGMTLVRKGAGQ